MITPVDYSSNSSVWSQDKWKGSFRVKWVYVKDVPNTQLRHIRLENNENKPVTNSRDTQEVPNGHGIQIMKIVHSYKHTTSIFDDFTHYEKRQEEEDTRKNEDSYTKTMTLPASHHSSHNRENQNRQQQQYDNGRGFDRDRDRDYNNGGGFDRGNSYNNGSYNKYGSGGEGNVHTFPGHHLTYSDSNIFLLQVITTIINHSTMAAADTTKETIFAMIATATNRVDSTEQRIILNKMIAMILAAVAVIAL
jgi:hypothetical protein